MAGFLVTCMAGVADTYSCLGRVSVPPRVLNFVTLGAVEMHNAF